jgi:arylsulfatase A-like enzyme
MLRQQGYATAHIGKWHLGDQPEFLPTRHGFETYFGMPYSNDMSPTFAFYAGKDFCPPLPLMRGENVVETEPDQSTLTERYTNEAVEYIRQHRDRPFFLYFAHMYVHVPLHPSDEWRRRSRNGDYGAEVGCIDWSTGQILAAIRELGIEDRTLVFFSSDNGATTRHGSSNAPLRGSKGTTWEGGLREPLIAWWPGTVPAGRACREMCTVMDFLPTFARMAGGDAPADCIIDGRDIHPLLSCENDAVTPHEAFCYYHGHQLQAVRSGRHKLHLQQNMLVDLQADVGETRDVADGNDQIVADLRRRAEECIQDLGDGEPASFRFDYVAKQTRVGNNVRPPGRVDDPRPLTK